MSQGRHGSLPRPSKKLVRTITFNLTDESSDRIDAIADEEDRTRSYVARRFIEKGLEAEEEDEPTEDESDV